MVEGPGCTHNGEKLRMMVGSQVVGVAGAAANCIAMAIRGRVLVDVITLGKQLWMIFQEAPGVAATTAETAVRCHFGMAGSLQCGASSQLLGPSSFNKKLTVLIRFQAGEVRVHDSTAALGEAAAARATFHSMRARDVCSSSFDFDAALAAILRAPADWMVADVLLDQHFLPGVGNIIKNEAIHRAATDPRHHMSALSREAVAQVVHEARAFSLAWCRGHRQPPCKVYNRMQCADCDGPVSFCKLGAVGAPRPTFWCQALCGGRHATANATGKRKRGAHPLPTVAPLHRNPWAAAARVTARPVADDTPPAEAPPVAAPLGVGVAVAAVTTPQVAPQAAAQVAPQVAAQAAPQVAAQAAARSAALAVVTAPAAASSTRPVCVLHGAGKVALRRVRKAGPNQGRLFYSCRGHGCELFKWADADFFPRCACPDAPIAGLRVSKKQDTGGRWFFGCRRDAKARCEHFAWAPANVATRLGGLLNPLT